MHGAIAVGFDIGSLCSKIAVAKRGGVDVIANETSRRKTPTLVAFDGDRRYIGESAESGWKRNIKNTIFLFKRFLGRSFNEEDVQKEINRGLPFILKEVPETGEVGVQVNYDGESKLLSIKQIMGVYLAHLKDITEKSLEGKTKVSDVVVGVPCYWAESQRRAMVDAIKIAGLNPIELIEETTAIALNYGIYKLDLDEKNPINVVFYDLGHTSLQVSVVSFTKGTFKVLSTAYDQFLGGRDFDAVIVEKLLVMIKEKYKLDVKSDPRAFLRLELAARSLRETLSANPKSPFFIECLMQEKDISFEFTRDMFEELAKPLFERLLKPLEVALEKAGLKTENLYAVEVVGDTRATPKLQNLLNDYLGKITIGKTMNCSEAVAKGCGWQAARLSPLFSVRKITLQTFNLFEIQAEFDWIHPENGNNVVNKEIELTTLFPEKTVVPSSKLITIPKNNIPEKSTIEVNLSYNGTGIPNPTNNRHSNPKHFVKFNITNIPLNNENVSKSAIKVGLKMNDSGLCTISKVYKEYTETITYEAEEEVPIEEEKKEEQKMDTTEDKEEQKMDTTEETKSEEKTEEKKEEPKKEVTKPKTKKVKVQKKKDVVKTTHLQFEESSFSFPSKEINTLQDFEIKMQKQDTLIISTLVAKNAVESYINDLKYELSENMSEYIEEQAKETYITFLNDTENWLYEEGENAEKKVYEEKLEELKKTGDPVKNRYTQAQDRPFYVERLTSAINGVLEFANSDDIKHEHITLEERDQLRKIANEAKNWLDENLNIINNQAKHIDPPIYYAQIITRQEEVEKKSHPIMSKPKPVEEKKEQPQQPTTEEKPTTENTPTEVPPQTEENGEKMDTTEDKQN